mmetsp:Transcript_8042/g.21427  ORF Transcript_8042/g.21427 Transcript_8042/m.21427 type:complete len:267 (+) Transcript_8042:1-801(+)|eukprot:1157974-Pelagomonas_calceolata.AAC.2
MQINKFLSSQVERLEPLDLRQAKALVDATLNSVGQSGLTNAEHDNLLKLSEALEDLDRMEKGQPPLQRDHEHADELGSNGDHQQEHQQQQQEDEGLRAQQMLAGKPANIRQQQQQPEQQEQQEPDSHRKKKRKLDVGTPPAASAAAVENGGSAPQTQRKKKRKDSTANGEHGIAGTPQQEAVQQQFDETVEHHGLGGEEQDRKDAKKRKGKGEQEEKGEQPEHRLEKKKKKKREREGSIDGDREGDGVKSHKKHKKHAEEVANGRQ